MPSTRSCSIREGFVVVSSCCCTHPAVAHASNVIVQYSRRICRCRIPLLHTNPAVAQAFNVIVHYSRRICRCRILLLHTNPAVAHAFNVIVQYSRRICRCRIPLLHTNPAVAHAFFVIVQYSRKICRCCILLLHTIPAVARDRAVFEKDFVVVACCCTHFAVSHAFNVIVQYSRRICRWRITLLHTNHHCCASLQRDRAVFEEGFVVVASRCCTRIPLLHMPST